MFRSLRVEFSAIEEFQRAYHRHIANGGLFVPTGEEFELHEVVDVELDLRFCDTVLPLQAEVVRRVQAGDDAHTEQPGVSIQFVESTDALRGLLAGLVAVGPTSPTPPAWLDRPGPMRRHDRSEVAAQVRLFGTTGTYWGTTRDLSRSGVLVYLNGSTPQDEATITVELIHPKTGQLRRIPARLVADRSELLGRPAVALEFELDPEESGETLRFLEDVRRVAGLSSCEAITGPIHIFGLPHLVQMFCSSAVEGTLSVSRGQEHARIMFQNGGLISARLGRVTGIKALSRILAWQRGRFEFHATAGSQDQDEPVPMYGAILEAVQFQDELSKLDLSRFHVQTRIERERDHPSSGDLDKLAEEILALVDAAPVLVHEVVDLAPGFDAQVYASLLELESRGLIRIT